VYTPLTPQDILPLTCSRKGTCCHGNQVFINAWELHCLAAEKGISPNEFKTQFCDLNGIRLKFAGEADNRGKHACNLYVSDVGCSVHTGRPLACRLFPLGRQIQNEKIQYVYQGNSFPCLDGCPEVNGLPKLSVETYLSEQKTSTFEQAQDAYLEVMQNLADIAFMLLLDTGLAASGDRKTIQAWREMGNESIEKLFAVSGQDWCDLLIIPPIAFSNDDPVTFVHVHEQLLNEKIQQAINEAQTFETVGKLCIMTMSLALILGKSIGADVTALLEMWVQLAEEHGAN
jgi:Fe-S-cluster containining protein